MGIGKISSSAATSTATFLLELRVFGPRLFHTDTEMQNTKPRKMAVVRFGCNRMRRLDGLRDCAIVDSRCYGLWTICGPLYGGVQEIQGTRARGGRESGGAGRCVGWK